MYTNPLNNNFLSKAQICFPSCLDYCKICFQQKRYFLCRAIMLFILHKFQFVCLNMFHVHSFIFSLLNSLECTTLVCCKNFNRYSKNKEVRTISRLVPNYLMISHTPLFPCMLFPSASLAPSSAQFGIGLPRVSTWQLHPLAF